MKISDKSKIIIDAEKELYPLGDMYGIFFEDINHAADGGLYAEMVQNRSFEFCELDNPEYNRMTAWHTVEHGGGLIQGSVESEYPMNVNNTHYYRMTNLNRDTGVVGIVNEGFNEGLPFHKGEKFRFSMFARRDYNWKKPVEIRITSADGEIYDSVMVYVSNPEWKRYTAELNCGVEDFSGRLEILLHGEGSLCIDMVSLFPDVTFRGRENGLRPDIAKYLEDLKPAFMRFPGGCLTHAGDLDDKSRKAMYRWKNSIGPLEERPSKANNWRYNQTLGFGYYEYFCFCEDIGTKPLPVLPGAHNPHNMTSIPLDELQYWIDDALDFIEFATGSAESKWGSVRAKMGHPAPFKLEYLAIGNEETEPAFFERYPYFQKAINEKYPDIKVLGTSGVTFAGDAFEMGWKSARENEAYGVDEHYYVSPDWLIQHFDRYSSDFYDANGPKVFLGEYASWGNRHYNALCEAAYMTGFERNADVVALTCYAPLFCNAGYINWQPDLIWYDNHRTYAIPSYYTQKMFSVNKGDMTLDIKTDITDEDAACEKAKYTGVFGINSQIESRFRNFKIDGKDCSDFEIVNGAWKVNGGCIERKSEPIKGFVRPSPASNFKLGSDCENFSFEFTAFVNSAADKPVPGRRFFRRGFSINFCDNGKSFFKWTLGGFANVTSRLSHYTGTVENQIVSADFTLEDKHEYNFKITKEGSHITCFVDGDALLEADFVIDTKRIYVSSSVDHSTNEVILKAVNVRNTPVEMNIEISGIGSEGRDVKAEIMKADYEDINTFDEPLKVSPVDSVFHAGSVPFTYKFEPASVNILRIPIK